MFAVDNNGRLLLVLDASNITLSVDTELAAALALADALSNPTVPQVGAHALLWNGATWDRQRNNVESELLASDTRTVQTGTPTQTNHNARGVLLILDVTANPGGAETLTLLLRALHSSFGGSITLASFPATAAATNGRYAYILYPGATQTIATPNLEVQALPLPRSWDAVITPSGAGSWTYQLMASLIR